jgi:small subunit ribosomal protein S14
VARHAQMVRLYEKPKFSTRHRNRCPICGRSRGYLRRWRLCRICFRSLALKGEIPGVTKASW